MGRFDGKVVVVTGAGQGVGQVTAKMFIDEGAKVLLTGRTASKLENSLKLINSPNAAMFHMDCGVEEDLKRLVEYVKKNYGEMDVLVNNAAIILGKDIHNMSFAEFKETEHCNLDSVFLGMKYCYEVLKKGVYSSIINVSSIGGLKAGPTTGNDAGYNATKAGVRNLTKHAAYVYAPDCIRVNSLHPAGINTQMRKDYVAMFPEAEAASVLTSPLPPHCAEPEEVAAAIMFLADPACRSITGSELSIDNCTFAI